MLSAHGYSLGESTIEALQFVKDPILQHILLYLTFPSQGLSLKLSKIQGNYTYGWLGSYEKHSMKEGSEEKGARSQKEGQSHAKSGIVSSQIVFRTIAE